MKNIAFILAAAALLLLPAIAAATTASTGSVVIYKNEACGHCKPYLEKAISALENAGYSVQIKEFINNVDTRRELAEIQDKMGVPLELQGHLVMLVDGKYSFQGHFPVEAMMEFLAQDARNYDQVVATQDAMTDSPDGYTLLSGEKAKECKATESIRECDAKEGQEISFSDDGGTQNTQPGFDAPGTGFLLALITIMAPLGFLLVMFGKIQKWEGKAEGKNVEKQIEKSCGRSYD